MPKQIDEIPLVTIKLDKGIRIPFYKQLYQNLRTAILEGRLLFEQKLPGTRSLANELNISRNTVNQAYEQLAIEGYIQRDTGSGSYINKLPEKYLKANKIEKLSKPDKRIMLLNSQVGSSEQIKRNQETEQLFPFQHGIPSLDEFPFNAWSKIISQSSRELNKDLIGYSDAKGYKPLRDSIAKYLTSYRGVNCTADQIIIVNGSHQATDLVARLLLKRGSKIWVEDPGYFGARASLIFNGAEIYPCLVDDEGLDLEFAKKKNPVPELIYITPSHQYPMGNSMSIKRRLELLQFASANNVWIIEDDYDSEFRYYGDPIPALQGMDINGNVLYLGTFSKVLFPGLRIGFIVLPNYETTELFEAAKSMVDRQNSILEQIAITKCIETGFFTRHIRKMKMIYKSRQEFLVNTIEKELNGMLRVKSSPLGMHLVGFLPDGVNDKIVSEEALLNGIIAPPLSGNAIKYFKTPGLILGYATFSNDEMKDGIKKLKRVLEKFA
ncbi:MAG: PLP-dependent aminotransferase family protein [Bacteroidetes bacterium]|nr:PLP-dependent aminotransferase family protein [Bacteroidota bacterium]